MRQQRQTRQTRQASHAKHDSRGEHGGPGPSDPLASPTLAALYVQQGHLERARGVVDLLLTRYPDDPTALALARRIRWLRPRVLELWTGETWFHLRLAEPIERPATVEIRCHAARGRTTTLVSSTWTPDDGLRQRIALPFESGAAVARLVSTLEGAPATLATTRVVTW